MPESEKSKSIWTSIIIVILYIVIASINLGIDILDVVVDGATVGVAGVGTGVVDLVAEIGLGIIQIILYLIAMLRSSKSLWLKFGGLIFIIIATVINIIFTVVGIPLPYIDAIETAVEGLSAMISTGLISWVATE